MRRKHLNISLAFFSACLALAACQSPQTPKVEDQSQQKDTTASLPFIGEHDIEFRKNGNGEMVPDSIYYTIPKFSFTNQDGKIVSHKDYQGKIFVADFFFTTCTSICPIMSSQMVRLQELMRQEKLDKDVWLLSHTVDPTHDNPEALKAYAQKIGANQDNWNFVTGSADDIYWQAQEGYMLTAFPSDTAQGGFFHTDKLTLIDNGMHIRGYYDGTSTKSVDKLLKDIKKLHHEQFDKR